MKAVIIFTASLSYLKNCLEITKKEKKSFPMMIHAKHKSASNFSNILDLWKAQLSGLPQMGKHF